MQHNREQRNHNASALPGRSAPLRIPIHIPTTAENLEKARNFVRLVNLEFEQRGSDQRLRLFAGNVEAT